VPKPNYKIRLRNFLFKHASPKNRKLRLRDDKRLLFDEIFNELMWLEKAIKKAPSTAIPERRKNGPENPEEILYWHFLHTVPVYLPDWGGFSQADLLYFKSRFEQVMGELT